LLLGIAGMIASFYLLSGIGLDEIGFNFLTALFGIGSLLLTLIFLILFARQLGSGAVRITAVTIEIPGHWTKRSILNIAQIELIGTMDSWDKVIKVSDGQRILSIDGKLLSDADLIELKTILVARIHNYHSKAKDRAGTADI